MKAFCKRGRAASHLACVRTTSKVGALTGITGAAKNGLATIVCIMKPRGTLIELQVVILERNKLVGRKVARLFLSLGANVVIAEDPSQLREAVATADVLCADTFDGDFVAEQARANPKLHGVLWTAEPIRRSLKYLVETKTMNHVLGRRDFDSPPRSWEMMLVARRLAGISAPPPIGAYLDWGFSSFELEVQSSSERDGAVAKIQEFVAAMQLPKRVAEMFGELAHELLMNAMYDAPVDAQGKPKYAGDRKAEIRLTDSERPVVRVGTDASRLVLQVRDPFGGLQRRHVFDGLARGLADGEMDTSHGGAGLGMMVCHNSSSMMSFDVVRGRSTEVTAVLELDMNLRELRQQAKSLHFWSA